MSTQKDPKKRKSSQEDKKLKKLKLSQMKSRMDKIRKDDPDLLLPVEDEDREKFYQALSLAFDVDPKIIRHIGDRDHLEFPDYGKTRDGIKPNFFQMINYPTEEQDVIGNVLHYLFCDKDMNWGEEYEFSPEEKKLRKEFHLRRKQKYASRREYLDWVTKMLFRVEPLYDEYNDCISSR